MFESLQLEHNFTENYKLYIFEKDYHYGYEVNMPTE